MTNDEKAKEIAKLKNPKLAEYPNLSAVHEYGLECAVEMAKWKDEQLYLLIDAIDHAYLQTDGTYGDLSYEVSDKVKYLKTSLKQPIK